MKQALPALKKAATLFFALTTREKLLIVAPLVFLLGYGLYLGVDSMNAYVDRTAKLAELRRGEYQQIAQTLKRYKELESRQKDLQSTFAQSQMTFEQVFIQLDKVLRQAIGSDNYDLKQGKAPSAFGFEYEKQDFTLNVKSIKIDQLVKLLYQIEQGERPLFLSSVQLSKTPAGTEYSATLEIYSIAKNNSLAPTA